MSFSSRCVCSNSGCNISYHANFRAADAADENCRIENPISDVSAERTKGDGVSNAHEALIASAEAVAIEALMAFSPELPASSPFADFNPEVLVMPPMAQDRVSEESDTQLPSLENEPPQLFFNDLSKLASLHVLVTQRLFADKASSVYSNFAEAGLERKLMTTDDEMRDAFEDRANDFFDQSQEAIVISRDATRLIVQAGKYDPLDRKSNSNSSP